MSINNTIFNGIKPYLHNFKCEIDYVSDFLFAKVNFQQRQGKAIRLIDDTLAVHGKDQLLRYVTELARVEYGIRELEPWVRDHVVHAVSSFLLGIFINRFFLRPHLRTFSELLFKRTPSFDRFVNYFQWKLAGLLHDVGYPVQIAEDVLKPFTSNINDIKRKLGSSAPDVSFKIVPVGLEKLSNNVNSFDLIQEHLNKWGLRINAREEYEQMVTSGKICHGMISGLTILYVIDLLYQKINPKREFIDIFYKDGVSWNQKYFVEDVVPACSAIFLHNLPNECYANAKISPKKAPLPFLLKLSDCLQEWERPSKNNEKGVPADNFDIIFDNGKLIMFADIPDSRKQEIQNEISCLDTSNILIS